MNVHIIDYKKWSEKKDRVWDTAAVFIFNLLRKANPSEVHIAGMDGFSANINENYFNPSFRISLSESEASIRNEFYIGYIRTLREEGMKIIFETPSKYNLE